jgi:DNA-binding protein HU-beta
MERNAVSESLSLRQPYAIDNRPGGFYHRMNRRDRRVPALPWFPLARLSFILNYEFFRSPAWSLPTLFFPVLCSWKGVPVVIKQDLIQRVVERTGLPRTKAEAAVDAIFDSMKQTLITGERIELRGFGVFTVKPRKTGIGRNPRTGAEVSIAPGKAVRFKPGKELHLLD